MTGDWDYSPLRSRRVLIPALFIVISAWFMLPRLIQTLQVVKTRQMVGTAAPAYTSLASLSQKAFFYLSVLVCIWIIAVRWRHSPSTRWVALIASVTPVFYMVIRGEYLGLGSDNTAYLVPLVMVAVWLLRPRILDLAWLGYLLGIVVVVGMLIGALMPDHGILRSAISNTTIVTDKQILPWGLLVGIFTDGNNFGQYIALSLPCAFVIPRRWIRWSITALTLFALVWTGSRGSMQSVAASLVAVSAVSCANRVWRPVVSFCCCAAVFVFGAVLPFLVNDPQAFTNRGAIWRESIDACNNHPLLGNGASYFGDVGDTSATLGDNVFHAHNQFLQVLVTGGVVYAVLIGFLLLVAVQSAARLSTIRSLVPTAYLVALGGVCVFEVSLVVVDNKLLFPAAVLPLAVVLFTSDLDGAKPATPLLIGAAPEYTDRVAP